MDVKEKVRPRTGNEGPEWGEKYSSTLSLFLQLEGVGDQRQAPAVLPLGKTRYIMYRRLGLPQGRSGRVRKISPELRLNWRTVQPGTSRRTD